MTALEFWQRFGAAKVRDVCGRAGTTFGYFKHIAHKRKRPSPELADELVKAAKAVADADLTAEELRKLPEKEEKADPRTRRREARKAQFAQAQARLAA